MFRSIFAVTVLALAAPALADGFSYTYLEGRYQRIDLDDGSFDVDGDGYGIAGAFALNESWHMFGGYNNTSFDFGIDYDELAIGAGFNTSLTPNMDFVARLAYVRFDVGNSSLSFDDSGLGVSIGVRAMASSNVELAASIQTIELSDSGNDTSLRGELWYSFTPNFAAGLNLGTSDDVLRYGLGGRFYFGN